MKHTLGKFHISNFIKKIDEDYVLYRIFEG